MAGAVWYRAESKGRANAGDDSFQRNLASYIGSWQFVYRREGIRNGSEVCSAVF